MTLRPSSFTATSSPWRLSRERQTSPKNPPAQALEEPVAAVVEDVWRGLAHVSNTIVAEGARRLRLGGFTYMHTVAPGEDGRPLSVTAQTSLGVTAETSSRRPAAGQVSCPGSLRRSWMRSV